MRPDARNSTRPGQSARRQPPRAASLVELMVVVALMSIMMGVVVSLLVSLQRWDQQFRARSVRCEQMARLAELVRGDIRRAVEATLESNQSLVIAAPGDRKTRYQLGPAGCRRVVEMPGDQGPRVESFSIAPGSRWTLERGPAGRRPLLMITLDQVSPSGDAALAANPLLVYAALGADVSALPGPIHGEEE